VDILFIFKAFAFISDISDEKYKQDYFLAAFFFFSFLILFLCHFHLIWPFFFHLLELLFIFLFKPHYYKNAPSGTFKALAILALI
jgi:hypothetical protein